MPPKNCGVRGPVDRPVMLRHLSADLPLWLRALKEPGQKARVLLRLRRAKPKPEKQQVPVQEPSPLQKHGEAARPPVEMTGLWRVREKVPRCLPGRVVVWEPAWAALKVMLWKLWKLWAVVRVE